MREGNQAAESSIWADMPTLLAAAHELKSPLVLIRQLALQLQDQSNQYDADSAWRIRLTAERSLQLLDGLTKAARLEDAMFESEPINMSELYDSIADELSPLAQALGQRIAVDVSRNAPTVIGNRSLLRSVLVGLCDNALAHNDRSKPIILNAKPQGEKIEVGVRDFGPRTDTIAQLKRQLGKTPQPLSSRPRSSGLGLLIAEQFASHMDASLSLKRHHQAGITLSLLLPRSRQLSLLDAL